MIELKTQEDVSQFATQVRGLMQRHLIPLTNAVCFLNTYPGDTHYCSGHGMYGDNRDTNDCPWKYLCDGIHIVESGEDV